MEISGLIKTSLIDYPEKIAAVIFTQGCNFQCGFCHNPDLIPIIGGKISEKDIFNYLDLRKEKLDGVVITGGEPSIQKNLEKFMTKIKDRGFLVKLDTNGSNPYGLQSLLDKKLIDYVAMDIKGPLEEYSKITSFLNNNVIQKSIELLINGKVSYEFRTTVLPYYHKIADFHKIGQLLKGAEMFTIQGFRSQITYDKRLKTAQSFSLKDLEKIKEIMKIYVKTVVIHDNII